VVVMDVANFGGIAPCSPYVYKPTFRINVSPPSSGSEISRGRNQRAGRWLDRRCIPEDGDFQCFLLGRKRFDVDVYNRILQYVSMELSFSESIFCTVICYGIASVV
jgi:hypothetical protein